MITIKFVKTVDDNNWPIVKPVIKIEIYWNVKDNPIKLSIYNIENFNLNPKNELNEIPLFKYKFHNFNTNVTNKIIDLIDFNYKNNVVEFSFDEYVRFSTKNIIESC